MNAYFGGPYFFGVFSLLIIGVVVWAVAKQKRSRRWLFDQLKALGAVGEPGSDALWFDQSGRRFSIDYFAGSKNSPSRFALKTPVGSPESWTVIRVGSAGRLLDGLGLGTRILTNDPEFDAQFHIDSDDPDFAGTCFSDSNKRAAVSELFRRNCAKIELDESRLSAVWTPFQVKKGMDLTFSAESLPSLAALLAGLPEGTPRSDGAGFGRKGFTKALTAGMIAVFLLFGLLLSLNRWLPGRPLDPWGLFGDSLKFSVPIGAMLLLLVIGALKTKSWIARAAPQLSLILLGFSIETGFLAYREFNAGWDASFPVLHLAPVLRKYQRQHKNNRTYFATLPSWRNRNGYENLEIDWALYSHLRPNLDCMAVTTRAGRLNREWIVSLEAAPQCGTAAR